MKVVVIHFIGNHALQLSGEHVKNFMKNYKIAAAEGCSHFYTEGEDQIMINMENVTFAETKNIEEEKVEK